MTRSIETRLSQLEARSMGRRRKGDAVRDAALREKIWDLLPHSAAGRPRMARERAEFEALSTAEQINVTRAKLEQARARLALELTPKRDGKLDLSCPELPWLQAQWHAIALLGLQGTSPERCAALNEHAGALARSGRWRHVRDLDPEAAYAQRTKDAEAVLPTVEAAAEDVAAEPAETPHFEAG